jgi:hypothetical protein
MQERIQLVSVARVLTFYRPSFYDIGYMSVGAIGDTCQAIASKEVKEKVALSVHHPRAFGILRSSAGCSIASRGSRK